jgi:tRNA pseudouridine38-40 synthase
LKRTYALKLAYDGGAFRGWQKQPGQLTVQGAVEDALRELLGKRYTLHGAARTDAGVHALAQVASFSSGRDPDLARLRLPPGAQLLAFAVASPSFHARASSTGKRYRYRFCAGERADGAFYLGAEARPDWSRARQALEGLAGLPEITGLASPSTLRKPAPPLTRWSLDDSGVLEVEARAFRKHQVRNLAGHLAAVALGLAESTTLAALAKRARPWMGATAPPHGLTLLQVLYPRELDPF